MRLRLAITSPPQPHANWDGIFAATSNIRSCYQVGVNNKYETEDCLKINVYTPVTQDSNVKFPVIMVIYGGTFRRGMAQPGYRKPQYVIEQGIIVVTMNYRVGPFGFLSTGDKIIPGNMGLKDQQFALKWIQRNIHLFGGDPDKVTLMGQSAGSASVTYQILSPGSKGLFRAAIAQSGSALCTWANQRHAVEIAYGIAAEIDSTFTKSNSTADLAKFLLSVKAKDIADTADKYNAFAPVIEVEHNGAIITESMYEAVKNGRINKVPLLMGFNSEEAIFLAKSIGNVKNMARRFDHDLSTLVDEDMHVADKNVSMELGDKIRKIYVNESFVEHIGEAVQYFSDNRFIRAIVRYGELQSYHTDVYFYQFSYHGKLGGNNYYIDGIPRVTHAEDMKYFWTSTNTLDDCPESDIITLDRYVGMLTNFVKTLNPTPNHDNLYQNLIWPKVTQDNFFYMNINTSLSIKENPREFSYRKWVYLFEEYARKPIISY